MADPLSLAASIAGIVQLSGAVFKLINKFVKDAKDAPSKVRDLAVQTRNLAGILENLKLLASGLDEESSKYALKAQHLNSCRHTLFAIEKKLRKSQDDFDSGKSLKSISRRLKWPLALPETNELLSELVGHCSTLQLALSADSMGALLKCLAKQDEVYMMMERKLSIDIRVQLNERRKEVMEFFLRVNPQDNFQMSLDLRHPLTGLWLTESDPTFQRWKELPNAKLWLSGIPGGGKTVLCGAVIETVLQDSNDSTAACFAFCDYKDAKSHQPENILSAIAVQLGQQKEQAFDLLEEYFDELNPKNQLQKQPRLGPLLMLVKDMANKFEKVYIMVDGLDECGENISSMVESLNSLAETSHISTALFSRKEEEIRDILEDQYDQIEIDAHTEDLEAYIVAQMSQRKVLKKLEVTNPSLYEEIFHTLLQGARGMFRWVACQINHLTELSTNKARRKALKELPPTLFGTYDRILDKVRKCPLETQVFVRKALHWISLGHHWITILQLCEAVSIEDGEDSIDEDDFIHEAEISRRCGCLIRKSVDGKYFELSHFTVMEYLQTQGSIGKFQYSEIKAFHSLADTSLRFLVFPCFNRKMTTVATMEQAQSLKRNETHPFYPFAASILDRRSSPLVLHETWRLVFGEEQVLARCKHLFDLSKPGYFMAWCLESMIHTKRRTLLSEHDITIEMFSWYLGAVLDSATTPLHLAVKTGMPKVCQFLLAQGADVNLASRFGNPLGIALYLSRFHSGDAAVTEIMEILLDHGADTSVGACVLAHALSGRVSRSMLPLIRPSTHVLDDAVHGMPTESSSFRYEQFDDDVLRAILKISTGPDAPPHWRPMASPALLLAKRKQITVTRTLDDTLYNSLGEEDLLQAIEIGIKNGLVEDVSLLLANPCLHGDFTRWESTVRWLLRLAAESKSSHGGRIMALLLDSEIAPDVAVSEIQNCFYISCKSGHAVTAQLMLARGARILAQEDAKGETVWHLAAARGETDLLRVLLGADSNVPRSLSTLSDTGLTPLSSAIAKGNIEASLLLLKHCSPDSSLFQPKNLLLFWAAKAGSRELFTALLASGVDLENESSDGSTPLHHLGATCSYDFVHYLTSLYNPFQLDRLFTSPFEKLLERRLSSSAGADSSNNSALDSLIPPSLTYSAGSGSHKTFHLWEIICNVIGRTSICQCEDEDEDNRRIRFSCDTSCRFSVGTAFRRGVLRSYENARNQPAVIPLIAALMRRPKDQLLCSSAISFLFENAIQDSAGTPSLRNIELAHDLLQRSVMTKSLALTKDLLRYGLDVHRCGSVDRQDALETACSEADFSTLKLILTAANPSRLNEANPSGHNLIDQVVRGSASETQKILMTQALLDKGVMLNVETDSVSIAAKEEEWDLVKFLLKLGGSMFVQDDDGWAVVHYVARDQDLGMLKSLLQLTSVTPDWEVTCDVNCSWVGREYETGVGLLHLASWNGNDDLIEYFLDEGLLKNIDISAQAGQTPLHCAAEDGKLSTCKLLVRRGAKLDNSTEDGNLAINYAIAKGNTEIAHVLLQAGSPLPTEWNDRVIRDFTIHPDTLGPFIESGPLSKLIWNMSLEKAILSGDLEACKSAIMPDKIHRPLTSCHSCTPLFAAIRACEEDVVEWLLEEGASPASVFCYHNKHCDLPQHAAERLSSAECLSKVLSAALENGISWYTGSVSPIYIAVRRDKADLLEAILTHVQENIQGYRNILESHLGDESRTMSDLAVMSLLINQAGDPGSGYRDTPLHCAVDEGKLAILKLLIKYGANVNARNGYQRTPLMIASEQGEFEIVRQLLASRAEVEPRDSNGVTAIAYAVEHGDLQIVKLLEDQSSSALGYISPDGRNLLSIATGFGSSREVFEYLISRGLDPGHCDRRGLCAFDTAMEVPNLADSLISSRLSSRMPLGSANPFIGITKVSSLRRLYKSLSRPTAQVFINLETTLSLSPMCEAASRDLTHTVALLLDLHANIELESSPFGTPLMYAAVFGRLDVVKLLVRRGAKLWYTNKNGIYRSAHVASAECPEVISWLLRGRFQDQSKLTDDAFWGDVRVRCWSGKRVSQVKIKSSDQRRWKESTLNYCKRVWKIRKGFAGQRVVGILA
ncbi:ankyrin repeat-containing domain protein [Dactylonectria estremocensis]|uniref:Ankyrin repeat-containing domain protein n=1 Tax=Dactylonectria estremocensis TaxID=1079267 RepID=A0A9P9DJE3_9HYPO|nr:ankyrin repeat-containing domain protein [Dactylonectria estremocensis]